MDTTISEWVLRGILALGGSGALVQYIRERKRNKAAETVAEKTVELKVDADRLANLEHRLSLTEKTFDLERESLHNQIRTLETDNENLRMELDRKDRKIDQLEERLEKVQTEIQALTSELAALRRPHDS